MNNTVKDDCVLCPPARPLLAENGEWRLVLNENQATLGRVYLASVRHETDVMALAPAEVLSLWSLAGRAKRALDTLFAPDHYNYLFHMNLTLHVHMHIYPRYTGPRLFAGEAWRDAHYGAHYEPREGRLLSVAVDGVLERALRDALEAQEDNGT